MVETTFLEPSIVLGMSIIAIALIPIIICLFIFRFRRPSVQFPEEFPSHVRFRECGVAGQMGWAWLGKTNGILDVIVTDDEIWIRLESSYNRFLLKGVGVEIEHRIRIKSIRDIHEEKSVAGQCVVLDYVNERGEPLSPRLYLRDPKGFACTVEDRRSASPPDQL